MAESWWVSVRKHSFISMAFQMAGCVEPLKDSRRQVAHPNKTSMGGIHLPTRRPRQILFVKEHIESFPKYTSHYSRRTIQTESTSHPLAIWPRYMSCTRWNVSVKEKILSATGCVGRFLQSLSIFILAGMCSQYIFLHACIYYIYINMQHILTRMYIYTHTTI